MLHPKALFVSAGDRANEELLRELLHLGYDLVFAGSDVEGLMRAPEEQPDLIVLDLCEGSMGDREFIRILRNNFVTTDIPVIALSGLEEPCAMAVLRDAFLMLRGSASEVINTGRLSCAAMF